MELADLARFRYAALLTLAVLCLVAAAAVPARAGDSVKTTVTLKIRGNNDFFFGRVKASELNCKNGREVILYRLDDGRRVNIGETFSSNGSYQLSTTIKTGERYFARVPKDRLPLGPLCKPDTSPIVTAG